MSELEKKKIPESFYTETNLVRLAQGNNYPQFLAKCGDKLSFACADVKKAGFDGMREFWKTVNRD